MLEGQAKYRNLNIVIIMIFQKKFPNHDQLTGKIKKSLLKITVKCFGDMTNNFEALYWAVKNDIKVYYEKWIPLNKSSIFEL